jgi:hypothetical protein
VDFALAGDMIGIDKFKNAYFCFCLTIYLTELLQYMNVDVPIVAVAAEGHCAAQDLSNLFAHVSNLVLYLLFQHLQYQ